MRFEKIADEKHRTLFEAKEITEEDIAAPSDEFLEALEELKGVSISHGEAMKQTRKQFVRKRGRSVK